MYLRALWDMAALVLRTFAEWSAMPWERIDTDWLVDETKRLQRDVKTLNKAVRNYEVYRCAAPAAVDEVLCMLSRSMLSAKPSEWDKAIWV